MMVEEKNSGIDFEVAMAALEAKMQALIVEMKNAEPEYRGALISEMYRTQNEAESLLEAERARRRELSRACPGGGYTGEVISEIAPSDIPMRRINFTPAFRDGLIMWGETLTVCLANKTHVKSFTRGSTTRHMTCGPLAGLLFDTYKEELAGAKFKITRKPGHLLVISPVFSSELEG